MIQIGPTLKRFQQYFCFEETVQSIYNEVTMSVEWIKENGPKPKHNSFLFALKLLIWTICLEHFDGWPVCQEVERIPEKDGLEAGDGLHPDDVGHRLGLVSDDGSVGDGQTVE